MRASKTAAEALGDMVPRQKAAVPGIAELFKDEDAEVRRAAVESLGKIGPGADTAVPANTKFFKDKDEGVRRVRCRGVGEHRSRCEGRRPRSYGIAQGQRLVCSEFRRLRPGEHGFRGDNGDPCPYGIVQGRGRGRSVECVLAFEEICPEPKTVVPRANEIASGQEPFCSMRSRWGSGELAPMRSRPSLARGNARRHDWIRGSRCRRPRKPWPGAAGSHPSSLRIAEGQNLPLGLRPPLPWR